MSLLDQDTGVVDRFGVTTGENAGLQTTVKELVDSKTKHVIQFVFTFVQKTHAIQTTDQSLTFEDTLRVLLVKGEQVTSDGTDLTESQLDAPDLTLVLETVLSDKLELGIDTLLLERTSRGLSSLAVYSVVSTHVVGL